ncbi:translocon-associated protein subunit delta [Sitophilus oryzae]|uniref:Translocon-associated protein subunit delta n=1 Tax=Sitophilus oryzae TaxID=7048 RepID=A0A6J2XBH7_SITOR|nr:translocon-associated protein subunit delta [Sitophilus oryzae]
MSKIFVLPVLLTFLVGFGSACSNPQVTSKSFTTKDATIVSHIGFISEITVKCTTGVLSSLYAELEDGSIIPVAVVAPETFQVSWIEESKSARSGQRLIRIFDEEGYTALRKAIRNNEPTGSVPEFFSVYVHHSGAYNGPWVKSEFIAVVLSILVSQFALTTKSKIVS